MKITREDQNAIVLKSNNLFGFIFPLIFLALGLILLFDPGLIGAKREQGNLLIPVVFIAIGLFSTIVTSLITTMEIDKGTRQITIARTRIIGRRRKLYRLDQVKEVRQEQKAKYAQGSRGGIMVRRTHKVVYYIVLVMKDGPPIRLPGSRRDSQWLVDKIAQFIGVPAFNSRPPTAGEALQNMREIISEARQQREQKKQSQGQGGGDIPPPIGK